jgi:Bacterial regulatory proteins, luxR family
VVLVDGGLVRPVEQAGETNTVIAQALFVSPGTVRKHLEHIYDKLEVRTRTAAAAIYTQERVVIQSTGLDPRSAVPSGIRRPVRSRAAPGAPSFRAESRTQHAGKLRTIAHMPDAHVSSSWPV